MTLAGRDSGDLSMTFRDLKSFGARLSDLSRTLAADPQTRVSDLKFQTLFGELPVFRFTPVIHKKQSRKSEIGLWHRRFQLL